MGWWVLGALSICGKHHGVGGVGRYVGSLVPFASLLGLYSSTPVLHHLIVLTLGLPRHHGLWVARHHRSSSLASIHSPRHPWPSLPPPSLGAAGVQDSRVGDSGFVAGSYGAGVRAVLCCLTQLARRGEGWLGRWRGGVHVVGLVILLVWLGLQRCVSSVFRHQGTDEAHDAETGMEEPTCLPFASTAVLWSTGRPGSSLGFPRGGSGWVRGAIDAWVLWRAVWPCCSRPSLCAPVAGLAVSGARVLASVQQRRALVAACRVVRTWSSWERLQSRLAFLGR